MSIYNLSAYELLEMYEDGIKSSHYNPCGDTESPKYDKHECRTEIKRRMDNSNSNRNIDWAED